MKKTLKEIGITEKQLRQIIKGRKRKPKLLKLHITEGTYKFGIVSDTHLCSIHEKLDELHTFYEICKKVGIDTIVHAGDIVAGSGHIYRGQLNELKCYGVKNQVNYVVSQYPNNGIRTYYILGNHDWSFWTQNEVDIGELISARREDMIYCGQGQADVEIGNVSIRLLHPDGGGAYALSYKGQKIAEQIPSGQKPDILILGHYHTTVFFHYRNMSVFQAGRFEGQSLFLLRKGINPNIGGWIVEVRIAKDARESLVAIKPSWIPFYT